MKNAPASNSPPTLNIIRFGLISGVLVLGMIAVFIAGDEGFIDVTSEVEMYLLIGLTVMLAGIVAGVLVLRSRVQRADAFSTRRGSTIVGWALAEAGAIVGVIYLILVGDPSFFAVGFAFQLFTAFVLLPLPSE